MKKFGQTAAECADRVDAFASALPVRRRKKKNPRNRKILKAPTSDGEPRIGDLVVLNTDGTVRSARRGETPIGKVIGRSHRIRNNKATFYASVAQSVERSVEAREAGVQFPAGAPNFREVEKRAMHAMNYGMSPGRIEEMYGGGSRAKIYGRAGIGKTGEVGKADSPGSEHAGIHHRPGWQREGCRPSWYNATGAEGGREGHEES